MSNVLPFIPRGACVLSKEARERADKRRLDDLESLVFAAGIVERTEGAAETIVTYLDLPA